MRLRRYILLWLHYYDYLTTSGSAVRWEGTGLGLIIGRGCENLRTKDQELWSMAVLTKHGSFTGAR